MAWIDTVSGKKFDFIKIEENEIDINDIAHSLSMICRFNGHVDTFYSVAEHSLNVAQEVRKELIERKVDKRGVVIMELAALLHDAHEAYTGDMTMPFKSIVKMSFDISRLENRIQEHIWKKLTESYVYVPYHILKRDYENLIKRKDWAWLVHENEKVRSNTKVYGWEGKADKVVDRTEILGFTPAMVKQRFVQQYRWLCTCLVDLFIEKRSKEVPPEMKKPRGE